MTSFSETLKHGQQQSAKAKINIKGEKEKLYLFVSK